MMIRRILLFGMLMLICICSNAQDPYYSQYYSAPLYLNPAFAGTGEGHRFVFNHRKQWPAIPNSFNTFSFSYDYNVNALNSGFGLLFTTDKAGSAGLRSTNVGFIYSYKVQMGGWVFSPSIQFAFGSRDLDFNKLVFGDQLGVNGPTQDDAMGKFEALQYMDFSTGALIYNKTFWLGYSVHHLNEPNLSLLHEVSVLPRKHALHGGFQVPLYRGPFKKERISKLAPSFVYKTQGNFDQLDVGLYYMYRPIMAGLWYRGIPVRQNVSDNVNHDALAVIFGLQYDAFEIGYSYDVTVSELGASSGGAHEISVIYQFISRGRVKKAKPDKYIPCPVFYGNGLAN